MFVPHLLVLNQIKPYREKSNTLDIPIVFVLLTLIRVISDNRLDDLGAIACDLLESVLRLIPEELIQGSRVQFHGIVKIGGVDRHVLERQREREKIKTNLSSKEGGFERRSGDDLLPSRIFSAIQG